MTADDLVQRWRDAFNQAVRRFDQAEALREAALQARLADWTALLTGVVVSTCEALGWRATGKGHKLDLLPVMRSEYLALDVVAFTGGESRWRYPVGVMELENSRQKDLIAYALWKVLCVRADLRVVYCYRQSMEESIELVHSLQEDVVRAMDITGRMALQGETALVVGSRDNSAVFPYGFFHWRQLDTNTGAFRVI